MKIISVVGARPNFMKLAPLQRAFTKYQDIEHIILHTGQHYDEKMSRIFFDQLDIPQPDYNLGIGGGSHTYQKAEVMMAFEKVLTTERPDIVLVIGDVNATAACSITAVKMGIKLIHIEAGLRSHDRRMSEEVNRIVTDAISDYLFVTEQSAIDHLASEGVSPEKVYFVGNLMIDNLIHLLDKAASINIKSKLGVSDHRYIILTMHRPSNVDHRSGLMSMIKMIKLLTVHTTVIFPVHPRTKMQLEGHQLWLALMSIDNLIVEEPLGYLEFLNLVQSAAAVVTDSGGIQEETSFLDVPCITFRISTERPVTIDLGTNILIDSLSPDIVNSEVEKILSGNRKKSIIPLYWDGKTADRIARIIANLDL